MHHIRFARLGFLAILFLFISLGGCGGGTASVNTSPVISVPRSAEGLQFMLSSAKAVYKGGEIVHLTFVVRNVSPSPIQYSASCPVADASVAQNDAQNAAPGWKFSDGFGCGASVFTATLPPNDVTTTTFSFTWQTSPIGATGKATTYTITAWFNPYELNQTPISKPSTLLASNPIQITIVP